jgi:glutathione peroxidase
MFQEPRNNKNIAAYCSREFHISFPLAAKVATRGFAKAPIYVWLTEKKFNGFADSKVRWNFQKFLINEEGKLTDIFSPKTKPMDATIIEAIEG